MMIEAKGIGGKWGLGHVYDLTEYFNKQVAAGKIIGVGDAYKYGYFVCHDVWDIHIYRVQVGVNAEYDVEPRTKIIETENISNDDLLDFCIEKYNINHKITGSDARGFIDYLIALLGLETVLKTIVDVDYDRGFETYNVDEYRYDTSLEELIEDIDGGYGISKIDL